MTYAYFAALERCPKIAPQRQVDMAAEFRKEIAACRDILDQIDQYLSVLVILPVCCKSAALREHIGP